MDFYILKIWFYSHWWLYSFLKWYISFCHYYSDLPVHVPTQQWNLTISHSHVGHTAFVNIPFRKVSQVFLKRDFSDVSKTINKLNTCWAFQRLWSLQCEKKRSRQKDQQSLNDLVSHWKIQVPVAKLLSINLKPLKSGHNICFAKP